MGSLKNKDDATHDDFTCNFFNDLTPSNVRKAVKMTNFVSVKCNKKFFDVMQLELRELHCCGEEILMKFDEKICSKSDKKIKFGFTSKK